MGIFNEFSSGDFNGFCCEVHLRILLGSGVQVASGSEQN